MMAFWGFALFALSHVVFAQEMPEPEYLDMLRATGKDEEFAKLMGIQDVSLLRENTERTEDPMFSMVSPLGDILLTAEQAEQARQGLNFEVHPGSKWPNVMPYYINPSDFSNEQIAYINKSIQALNGALEVLDIRSWKGGDNDYIYVISGEGCYSNLGRVGGRQILSLNKNGCLRPGIVQHQFIHASGVQHEHNRPDRDNFIKMLYENIPPEWQPQYEKGSDRDYKIFGSYDYYSVMHYSINVPGTNNPAFQVPSEVNQKRVGQREGITQTDADKLNAMYN